MRVCSHLAFQEVMVVDDIKGSMSTQICFLYDFFFFAQQTDTLRFIILIVLSLR